MELENVNESPKGCEYWKPKIGWIVIGIIGIVYLFMGVLEYIETSNLLKNYQVADGTIVRVDTKIEYQRGKGEVIVKYPTIEFVTAEGEAIHYRPGQRTCDVGDKVTVYYNNQSIRITQVGDPDGVWRSTEAYFVVGSILLGFIMAILLTYFILSKLVKLLSKIE